MNHSGLRGLRVTKRQLVTSLAAATVGVDGIGYLSSLAAATTRRGASPRRITAMLDVGALAVYGTQRERFALFQNAINASFRPAHPDIHVDLVPWEPWQPKTTAMLAGKGADVFADFYLAPFVQQGLVLQLDEYIKTDNVDMSIWSPNVMNSYRFPKGLFAINRNLSPSAVWTTRSVVADAGLSLPDPEWDWTEYTRFAKALTKEKGKQHRYGASINVYSNQIFDQTWIYNAFRGSLLDKSHAVQLLSTPPDLQAGDWVYHQMVWPGIATQDQTSALMAQGLLASFEDEAVSLLTDFTGLLDAGIRDIVFLPAPVYPAGHSCWAADNFWAINAQTKEPEASWELLKWLTVDSYWQRFAAKTFLLPPCLVSLYPEWKALVESTVPLLRGTGLEWFVEAAVKSWGYAMEYFAYDDLQAENIDNPWIAKVSSRRIGVRDGFTFADHQVNAFERTAENGVS